MFGKLVRACLIINPHLSPLMTLFNQISSCTNVEYGAAEISSFLLKTRSSWHKDRLNPDLPEELTHRLISAPV